MDVLDNGLRFLGIFSALIMHLIPTIILTTILLVFLRKSKILGTRWIIFGIGYVGTMIKGALESFEYYYLSWSLILAGPALVMGYLFFRETKN